MSDADIQTQILCAEYLLGDLMYSCTFCDGLEERISAAPMIFPAHRKIMDVILERLNANELPDPVSIDERLRGDPEYDEIGGISYLCTLICDVAKDLNWVGRLLELEGTKH